MGMVITSMVIPGSHPVKSWMIMTRYLPDYEITKKTRVVWDSRILTPNVPVNIDSLKIWMTFEATEQTD